MTSKLGSGRSEEVASEAQRKYLDRLGLTYSNDITAAAASDLIGMKLPPEPETVEMLKFLGISSEGMTQTDARKRLADAMANPENKQKWAERSASKDQTDCLEFFKQVIPKGLTHSVAEIMLRDLFADEAKADAWDAEVERRELAESEIDDFIDLIADYADDHACRKPSKKLARAVVLDLLANGVTVERIEAERYTPFFRRAAELDPSIVKDAAPFQQRIAAACNMETRSMRGEARMAPGNARLRRRWLPWVFLAALFGAAALLGLLTLAFRLFGATEE